MHICLQCTRLSTCFVQSSVFCVFAVFVNNDTLISAKALLNTNVHCLCHGPAQLLSSALLIQNRIVTVMTGSRWPEEFMRVRVYESNQPASPTDD